MADNALGLAIAGGAIAAALIDVLVDKQILTIQDRTNIFAMAGQRVRTYRGAPGAGEAITILDALESSLPKRNS